jgi:hypothetical protein
MTAQLRIDGVAKTALDNTGLHLLNIVTHPFTIGRKLQTKNADSRFLFDRLGVGFSND